MEKFSGSAFVPPEAHIQDFHGGGAKFFINENFCRIKEILCHIEEIFCHIEEIFCRGDTLACISTLKGGGAPKARNFFRIF